MISNGFSFNTFTDDAERFHCTNAFKRGVFCDPFWSRLFGISNKTNHIESEKPSGTIVFPRIISGELCRFCGARDPRWPFQFGVPDTTLLIVGSDGRIVGSIINIGKDKSHG